MNLLVDAPLIDEVDQSEGRPARLWIALEARPSTSTDPAFYSRHPVPRPRSISTRASRSFARAAFSCSIAALHREGLPRCRRDSR